MMEFDLRFLDCKYLKIAFQKFKKTAMNKPAILNYFYAKPSKASRKRQKICKSLAKTIYFDRVLQDKK